jgi:hypothetical protein
MTAAEISVSDEAIWSVVGETFCANGQKSIGVDQRIIAGQRGKVVIDVAGDGNTRSIRAAEIAEPLKVQDIRGAA